MTALNQPNRPSGNLTRMQQRCQEIRRLLSGHMNLGILSHHMEPTGTRPATRWIAIKTGQRGDN